MTILFRNDWLKHPEAIIHYSTKNKSFLKLAQVYYKMGIKNCAFHLSLLNPLLEHVDPFDIDNLTNVEIGMILEECMNNFWYYLREIMKVDSSESMSGAPFGCNRSNIAVYWLYFNHIQVLNTVIRQTGKTTSLKALYIWLLSFGLEGAALGLVTKDTDLKNETMVSIKEQFDYLPYYLRMDSKNDIMNTDLIHLNSTNGNKLRAWLSNSSKIGARKVGRGFTIGTFAWDEICYIPNIEEAMGAAVFSGNNARPTLKAAGLPYGTVMFTTVGDMEDRDGKYIYNMVNNSTLFLDKFFDCADRDELERMIYTNSSARNNADAIPMCVVSYSYRQMGFSEQWMKDRLAEAKGLSRTAINRDLYNIWVASNSESPLDPDEVDRLKAGELDEYHQDIFAPFNYVLRWTVTQEEVAMRADMGHSIIVGIDTSEGNNRDDIAFKGRDSATGEVLVTGTFNGTNILTLANFFTAFLIKYQNSTMIIERKSTGPAILDAMVILLSDKGINPYTRLYNTLFQDELKYAKEIKEVLRCHPSNIDVYNKYKDKLGFSTSGGTGMNSRSLLFSSVLRHLIRFCGHLVKDKITITQFLGLVIRNGRVDHAEGGHDDLVIAILLSHWFFMFAKNVHYYNIDSRLMLKKNDIYLNDKFEINGSAHRQREIEKVEAAVSEVIELIRNENNPIIVDQLERKLTFLYKDVKHDANYVNIDDLKASLRKEKQLKRMVA